ncbi:AraC family transcriptional regulator [Massilia sp. METH4]|uniref:AraC family transcriptional regulator n=1 Tax=Massilia sp. METH4 TaxID=3123041 RepID=UPI0030D162A4
MASRKGESAILALPASVVLYNRCMSPDPRQPLNQATFGALANGVTLMRASFADHAFERHSHDSFAIGTTTHGIQRFRCKGRQYDSQPGDFVLFNPEDDHDGRGGTEDGFRYTIWYVPEEFITSGVTADGPARERYFSKPHVTDAEMAERFSRLSISLAETPAESLRVESLMLAFLGTMLCRHGERPESTVMARLDAGAAALARAKDYIRTCYANDMTVSDLAAAAGLSRAHLTRAFSAAYHMPPHMYLNAVRIAQAQARIRLGMPLALVALECGFADQSHLTRRFKGSVGVTPSAWRTMTCAGAKSPIATGG